MKEISINTYQCSPFEKIGSEWMLISAGSEQACSSMTASWGGLGVLWAKPVSFVFIRPQRHTLQLVDQYDYYSLSFFSEEYRAALNYCGSHSGGENQKIAAAGLHLLAFDRAPVFAEASMTMICKKLYRQPMDPACFIDPTIDPKHYPAKDYHNIFVGEIVQTLVKD